MPFFSPGISGAGTVITTGTLGSDAAAISITGIPAGFRRFEIKINPLSSVDAAKTSYLRFNNDSGANYTWYRLKGGAAIAHDSAAGTNQIIGYVPKSSFGYIYFNHYTVYNDAAGQKKVLFGQIAYSDEHGHIYGYWSNTTEEIDEIDFVISADNYEAGTTYEVVGYE